MKSRPGLEAALAALLSAWFGAAGCCEGSPVIIDTDMALDDVRAIALLACSKTLEIKAVVTSDGAAGAAAGYENALAVLAILDLDHVPVGMGRPLDAPPPPWRGLSDALGWSPMGSAGTPGRSPAETVAVVSSTLDGSAAPVDYICLGPLTNLAQVLREKPALATRIARVLYVGSKRADPTPGWNTLRDTEGADRVLGADLTVYQFDLEEPNVLRFDSGLWQEVGRIDTVPSNLIYDLHRDSRVQALLRERHFCAWDETVALYLHAPTIASTEPLPGRPRGLRIGGVDVDAARNTYLAILRRGRAGRS
ncbi:MAG: nucleoside hydrolase [Acidobacteriota bacterium]